MTNIPFPNIQQFIAVMTLKGHRTTYNSFIIIQHLVIISGSHITQLAISGQLNCICSGENIADCTAGNRKKRQRNQLQIEI